jgi:D-serine deaminase-like pyridoxal phosphate-dependent protein
MSFDIALKLLNERSWKPVPLAEPIPVSSLPTPALLIDESALDRNIERMATFVAARGKGARPHGKTHKCPVIASRQIEAGAVGICAAKVSEAAVFVNAGVEPVLITSPVTTPAKAALIVALARKGRVSVVVDGPLALQVLREAASPDAEVGVLVDIDVDMGRTGCRDPDQVLELAESIETTPGLRYEGVQHYAGHLMHVEGHQNRRRKSTALWEQVAGVVDRLRQNGLPPEVVTGGGTGTYDIDTDIEAVTDVQVGSYVFMDHEYRIIGGARGEVFDDFEVALTVAATAISKPLNSAVTVDAGYKAFASDTVAPEPMHLAGARYRFAGDEHGVVIPAAGSQEPLLGEVHQFITSHCDPTVNLYDHYWVHRDGLAHSIWPVAARGCSW